MQLLLFSAIFRRLGKKIRRLNFEIRRKKNPPKIHLVGKNLGTQQRGVGGIHIRTDPHSASLNILKQVTNRERKYYQLDSHNLIQIVRH